MTQVARQYSHSVGGANRLWSLWDLMNLFDAKSLCKRLADLAWIEAGSHAESGGKFPLPRLAIRYLEQIAQTLEVTDAVGLVDASRELRRLSKRINGQPVTYPGLNADAATARNVVIGELDKRKFLFVAPDRVDCIGAALFGAAVFDNFETARPEIQAAGECLAAECPTAAVFHLMRVAEIGLRALAYDRDVRVFKNARTMFEIPLELATWDQLIVQLEDAERAIQGFPQTLARESQFAFYHGALMQYRAFKNVFRNNIMHAREMYDRDEAFSAFNKVREFMQILATKLRENHRTPTIWTTP